MRSVKNRPHYAALVVAVLLFAAAVVWFVVAAENAENASQLQQLQTVKRSVENTVTLCYSIEGAYPESLAYLEENYRLSYDKQRYIVHYECFASNIRPQVMVVEKESAA